MNLKKKIMLVILIGAITSVLTVFAASPSTPPGQSNQPFSQAEPRTPITSVPLTITQSGSYYLTKNLTATGTAITIQADDVTIDLCGFTLSGPNSGWSSSGILIEDLPQSIIKNVEIRNGTIRDFGFGINASGDHHRIIGVRLISNESGISMVHIGHLVTGCLVSWNGRLTSGYTWGIDISASGCIVSDNTVVYNGSGAIGNVKGIVVGEGCIVTGNTVSSNGIEADGDVKGIEAGEGCTVTGNTVYDNGVGASGDRYGVRVDDYCLVDRNTAYSNGTNISAPATCVLGTNCAP